MAENFQDNVQYGSSTLGVSGNAISIGTAGGAKSLIFNNSDTVGHLAWNPSANRTVNLPDAGGTVLMSSQALLSLSAGGARVTSGEVVFSNSNGVSFGVNGQTVTGSVAAQTNQSVGLYGVGNTTQSSSTTLDARTISFDGLGGITVGFSNGSVQISGPQTAAQTVQSVGLYGVGNTTQSSSTTLDARTLSFRGNQDITVGYSNGSVQLSVNVTGAQSNQTVGLYAVGNTTQSSSTTLDARTLSFDGLGGITVGFSNGSVQVSGPQTVAQTNQSIGLYAVGNTTQSSSTTLDARTLSFRGNQDITVGYSNGSVQLSVNVTGAQTVESQTLGVSNLGNTAGTSGVVSAAQVRYLFAGGNNVTLSQSLNGASGTVTISAFNQTVESQSIGMSNVGNTSGTTGMASGGQVQFVLAGGNNITLSQSLNGASGTITISAPNLGAGAFSGGASNLGNTAGSTGATGTRLVFVGTNAVSLSQSTDAGGGTLSINVAAQTNQTVGLYALGNTTQSSSTTLDARTLSFNGLGAMTVGYSNGSIQLSVPPTSSLSATGIVSISINGSTISIGAATANFFATGNTTQSSSSNLDLRSITFNALGGLTAGFSNGSVQLSVPNQSMSVWEPYPLVTGSAYSSHAPASWWVNRVVLDDPVVISNVYVAKSVSMGVASATSVASAGSQKFSYSHGFTVFSRQNYGTGSTNLTTVGTASFGLSGSLTYTSTSIQMGYSWVTNSTGGTTSFSTTSSSSNLATYFSGAKLFPIPWVTTLLPGEYFFAHQHSSTTLTANSNVTLMSFSNLHVAPQLQQMGVLGSSGTFSSLVQAGAGMGVASAITTNNTYPMSVVSGGTQNLWYMAWSNAGP